MAVSDLMRRWAWVTGLRGVLMVLAGLYAVVAPGAALTLLWIVGGVLLVVDGALGLWSLTFGGAKTGNYWFDVVRNVLALILGVLILISPLLTTVIGTIYLVYLFAIQAIIVGVMEIVVIVRERANYARIWPVLLSGALYIIFGIALLFWPLDAAMGIVIFGGLLTVLFGVALIGYAFRLNKRGKEGPAATEA